MLATTLYFGSRRIRSMGGKLLDVAQNSRPDIAYEVASLSQVPYGSAGEIHMQRLNGVVNYVTESKDLTLKSYNLDQATIRIYVFVDFGYNTNLEQTSQLGLFVFLADKNNRVQFIYRSFSECQRVTRSMLVKVMPFSRLWLWLLSEKCLIADVGRHSCLHVY